ncbi:hypothetical protein ACWD0B_30385, partial [Streptomyces cellulosae]
PLRHRPRRPGARRALPAAHPDPHHLGGAEPDTGWPGAGSAAPWGVSDTDGDADWPDEEITPGGDARESWEGSA